TAVMSPSPALQRSIPSAHWPRSPDLCRISPAHAGSALLSRGLAPESSGDSGFPLRAEPDRGLLHPKLSAREHPPRVIRPPHPSQPLPLPLPAPSSSASGTAPPRSPATQPLPRHRKRSSAACSAPVSSAAYLERRPEEA